MIRFVTGVIGSGKTYFSLLFIVKNFVKDEELKKKIKKDFEVKNIDFCYTNINGLDLSKFDNVENINFKNFYNYLSDLYALYKDNVTDVELNEKASEYKLSRCLIVFDECHNYLSKKDDVLIWWLSYARHLYQEIILVTQNLSLVDSKYKAFSEHFYKAFPSSLRISKNKMRYNLYSGDKMYNTQKVSVISVSVIPDVFLLYNSGSSVQNKSFIQKFGLIALVLLLLFFLAFFIIRYFMSSSEDKKNVPVDNEKVLSQSNIKQYQSENGKNNFVDNTSNSDNIVFFKCSKDSCYYKDVYLNVAFVKYIIKGQKLIFKRSYGLYFFYCYSLNNYKFKILDKYVNANKIKTIQKFDNNNTYLFGSGGLFR